SSISSILIYWSDHHRYLHSFPTRRSSDLDSLLGSYLMAVSASSKPRTTHFWIWSKSFCSFGFLYVTLALPPSVEVILTSGSSVTLKEQSQSFPARIAYASARFSLDMFGSWARAEIHSRSFASSLIAAYSTEIAL